MEGICCRNIADCECTHNNSCNWFWSLISCMGYSPVGLGHRHGSSDDFLFYHLFHLDFIGRQLPITGPRFRQAELHLHGCGSLSFRWFSLFYVLFLSTIVVRKNRKTFCENFEIVPYIPFLWNGNLFGCQLLNILYRQFGLLLFVTNVWCFFNFKSKLSKKVRDSVIIFLFFQLVGKFCWVLWICFFRRLQGSAMWISSIWESYWSHYWLYNYGIH